MVGRVWVKLRLVPEHLTRPDVEAPSAAPREDEAVLGKSAINSFCLLLAFPQWCRKMLNSQIFNVPFPRLRRRNLPPVCEGELPSESDCS